MFADDFTLTKRQLGILLLSAGVIGFLAVFSIDLLDSGRQGGVGPAQRIGLAITVIMALVGLTLIPLGDNPA